MNRFQGIFQDFKGASYRSLYCTKIMDFKVANLSDLTEMNRFSRKCLLDISDFKGALPFGVQ